MSRTHIPRNAQLFPEPSTRIRFPESSLKSTPEASMLLQYSTRCQRPTVSWFPARILFFRHIPSNSIRIRIIDRNNFSTCGVCECDANRTGSRNQRQQCNGGDNKGGFECGPSSESHCVLDTRWLRRRQVVWKRKLANGGD